MLSWLARTAEPLVGRAPGVAAELLARAGAPAPRRARPSTAGWPGGFADALFLVVKSRAAAEQVVNRALDGASRA